MPNFFKVDKERRVVLSTISGELTYAEALAHQQELSRDKDFDPTFAHIPDFSYATLAKISGKDVVKFAQRSIFWPKATRAMIISNLSDYGLADGRPRVPHT